MVADEADARSRIGEGSYRELYWFKSTFYVAEWGVHDPERLAVELMYRFLFEAPNFNLPRIHGTELYFQTVKLRGSQEFVSQPGSIGDAVELKHMSKGDRRLKRLAGNKKAGKAKKKKEKKIYENNIALVATIPEVVTVCTE